VFDLKALKVFLTVAELASMTAAAKRLGLSQSAVSQAIRQLEESTGAVLIDRERRPLALTAAGAGLRQRGAALVAEAETLYKSVREQAGAEAQMLIPLAPAVPWVAMGFLIATQVIGDGALTVYLVNETTLRQRLLPPEALGRSAATWQFAAGLLTPVGALTGAALAQTLGMRPTLWVLAFGIAIAAATLAALRSALPGSNAR